MKYENKKMKEKQRICHVGFKVNGDWNAAVLEDECKTDDDGVL